jgi:beta-lactamase regulating signal transducer with metallopeptidase domain
MDLHQLAQISAQGVLNSIAEGIAIALFAAALLKLLGRRNSGTRFAVWFSALLAVVLLPFFTWAPNRPLVGSASPAITLSSSWAEYLLIAWAVISTIALLRVAVGIWHLVTLRRSCSPVDCSALDPLLQSTITEGQSVRRISICVSDRLQVPTAIGFFRPAVVLPSWTFQELSTPELNAILLHELAHLHRWDDWTNLAQKLARAILFFHPAVWWIESKLSVEREMACDEIALARTEPKAYAQCLVRLAEKNFMHRGFVMAQAAVHRAGQTAKRLAQILDRNRSAATLVSKPAVATVIVFATACFAVAPHTPQIVAFGDKAPVTAVSNSAHHRIITPAHAEKLGAKVIPASFVVHDKPIAKPAAKPAATHSRKLTREDQQRTLHLVRTSAPAENPAPIPTYVVMQTRQQFNQAGPDGIVWTLTVWRVTVIQQDQPETDPALRSKST